MNACAERHTINRESCHFSPHRLRQLFSHSYLPLATYVLTAAHPHHLPCTALHDVIRWASTRESTIQHFKWSKRSVRASLLFMVAVSLSCVHPFSISPPQQPADFPFRTPSKQSTLPVHPRLSVRSLALKRCVVLVFLHHNKLVQFVHLIARCVSAISHALSSSIHSIDNRHRW